MVIKINPIFKLQYLGNSIVYLFTRLPAFRPYFKIYVFKFRFLFTLSIITLV